MAIFAAGVTQAYVTNNAQAKLAALRRALNDVHDFYLWLSAYSSTDLVALGFTSGDATEIFTAFADADQLRNLYSGGALGGTYTLPYNFSASQRVVIGPLT